MRDTYNRRDLRESWARMIKIDSSRQTWTWLLIPWAPDRAKKVYCIYCVNTLNFNQCPVWSISCYLSSKDRGKISPSFFQECPPIVLSLTYLFFTWTSTYLAWISLLVSVTSLLNKIVRWLQTSLDPGFFTLIVYLLTMKPNSQVFYFLSLFSFTAYLEF